MIVLYLIFITLIMSSDVRQKIKLTVQRGYNKQVTCEYHHDNIPFLLTSRYPLQHLSKKTMDMIQWKLFVSLKEISSNYSVTVFIKG